MVQSALADIDDVTALEPAVWLHRLPVSVSDADRALLEQAWERARAGYGERLRDSGEPYFAHAVYTATILAELGLDAATLAAALIHDLPELQEGSIAGLRKHLGGDIAELAQGVCRMHGIGRFRDSAELEAAIQGERVEGLRKMLLAMARDVRVVFIALAERLHDLRSCRGLDEEGRMRLARETRDIYAPLANRLGIWQLKWELEDLAFRHLEPEAYMDLAKRLAERRRDREAYIEQVCSQLQAAMDEAGLKAEVYGRPKHIYSIYRKMQRKGLRFDDLYDLRAVRILVDDERTCYAALGIVHGLWTPIPREFDDYIATPKENNYRSLHTAVAGPEGKAVEVQIRTHEMHAEAELGIAAHWRYKEGGKQDAEFEQKIAWLRQILEWGREDEDDEGDFVDRVRAEVFADRVYALTPGGDVIDLPRGATALDFAYHIHTGLGHRCRGAKINNRIAPLTRALDNGDRVEILTSREERPSRDWINPELGYLYTNRARTKVRTWFRQRDHDKNVAAGRQALDKELRRLGLEDVSTEEVVRRSRYTRVELFLSALGRGEVTPGQIAALLRDRLLPQQPEPASAPERPRATEKPGGDGDITVEGVGNLLTRMARCCSPAPGDPIIGFITRGAGVTIHRQDCRNVEQLREREPERLLDVNWRTAPAGRYPVRIHVRTGVLDGPLSEITRLCGHEGVRLDGVQTHAEPADAYRIDIDVQVSDVQQLSRLMAKLSSSERVERVWRGT
ncbi:RelA/SpoT family protein [Halorhodospira halophila]|uniref:GTP pyrophosphokinase n=1 Tax=Halorhodospira halophila (strain DSM 244 / SL1) TaxID=349124 RepID=A1WXU2_HALHL|nr:bifunctional (p)ppGpp synthetase/guanosine-3',5'-bis(diphosphate) 3'-pyrophosphohydrolase [Halorhodospira halophila]ABM62504.1 metal dependent phosphohydrolase [Halorhodospira halophila SL1]MBK1728182.1 bifunctional (p)ppGpp synthetase/guanosine-3',5'-bis(diphosphate) 3'-pyrophosphohydrolase [Halorhodospira halophila]